MLTRTSSFLRGALSAATLCALSLDPRRGPASGLPANVQEAAATQEPEEPPAAPVLFKGRPIPDDVLQEIHEMRALVDADVRRHAHDQAPEAAVHVPDEPRCVLPEERLASHRIMNDYHSLDVSIAHPRFAMCLCLDEAPAVEPEKPTAPPPVPDTVAPSYVVSIAKGDSMLCAVLADGKPTKQRVLVTVLEVKRHWKTQEPMSVRVKTRQQPTRYIWVQAQYLTPAIPQYVA